MNPFDNSLGNPLAVMLLEEGIEITPALLRDLQKHFSVVRRKEVIERKRQRSNDALITKKLKAMKRRIRHLEKDRAELKRRIRELERILAKAAPHALNMELKSNI